jgi:hypothetical protein
MTSYTYAVHDNSWISSYSGPFGGDSLWSGWTLANTSDSSYVTQSDNPSVASGAVSISDNGVIPTTITAVGSTVVILRLRQAGDESGVSAIINNASIASAEITPDANFTSREFTMSGATTRAQMFSYNYGSRVGAASAFSHVDWSGVGVKFNFTLAAPTCSTGSASNLSANSADVAGTINASGGTTTFDTEFYFEYGLTTSYGSVTSTTSGYTGTSDQGVSKTITGLNPNTTYHYRIVALNDDNTVLGSDQTFITTAGDEAMSFF